MATKTTIIVGSVVAATAAGAAIVYRKELKAGASKISEKAMNLFSKKAAAPVAPAPVTEASVTEATIAPATVVTKEEFLMAVAAAVAKHLKEIDAEEKAKKAAEKIGLSELNSGEIASKLDAALQPQSQAPIYRQHGKKHHVRR